jgi:hypothetical protein
MRQIRFGRFEFIKIERHELVLDPWPSTTRNVKFDAVDREEARELESEFALKKPVAEFFEYVRSVEDGEIRCLEIRHSQPFAMQTLYRPDPKESLRD